MEEPGQVESFDGNGETNFNVITICIILFVPYIA